MGQREAFQRLSCTTLQPLGNLIAIAAEASAKLERKVSFGFERLRGADL